MKVDEAPERLRQASRALVFAENRGAFAEGSDFTSQSALGLAVDLLEAADTFGAERAQRAYALRSAVRPRRRRSFWRRLFRI